MNQATERQVAFINNLVVERAYAEPIDFANLTSKDASQLINTLIAMPHANQARAITELGVYKTPDNIIYRVHKSRETGNLYAKMFDIEEMKFIYSAGAMRLLRPEWKMTLEDAKRFGMETGICCVCGAYLTDARSVAEGIGPVCAGRV